MATIDPGLLHIVHFADLTRWSALDATMGKIKSKFPLVPLSAVLRRIKEPISIEDGVLYKRITVRNNGRGVVQRDELHGREIGTKRQFIAHAGQLIISRIDARNGAFGIVPKELEGAIVTNDFWLFEVHDALTEYLILVLSSKSFQEHWQSQSSGTTNRQRVSEETFLESKIALPSVEEQTLLLSNYFSGVGKAEEMRKNALMLKASINDTICSMLGVVLSKQSGDPSQRLMFVKHSECDKWSVDYLVNKKNCDLIKTSRYPIVSAGDFIIKCQYGLSEKSYRDNVGVPVLRMTNLKDSSIDVSDLKYLPESTKAIRKYLLKKGDILFNRTNSKELVGKTAVFSLDGDYVFASYLIRVLVDSHAVNADYINYLFASSIVRTQIDSVSRQVLGQANINIDELKSLRIPLPPLLEQLKIVSKIKQIIQKASAITEAADALEKGAKLKLEEAIFQ